jgi:lysophospholipase L1-like esterase
MSRARRAAGAMALLLLGSAAALAVGEVAVRIYAGAPLLPIVPPEPYVDNAVLYRKNPTRRYELRPGVDETVDAARIRIRINAAGFRDDLDYPQAKAPGTFRVVVLGDSFTFAGKVPVAETMPKRLEGQLREADPSRLYEVLNLAVPGYNAAQEAVALEETGLRYHPDLVLVAFVLNDALPAGQLVPAAARLPESVRRPLKRSYLVRFLYDREKRIRSLLKKGSFKGASELQDLAPGTEGFARVTTAFEQMRRACMANGAALLVVIWPMLERLDAYPFADRHVLVAEACREREIPVLDLLPTFRGLEASDLWAARDDHHPNREAQRRAADAIFTELRGRGLVPGGPAAALPTAGR